MTLKKTAQATEAERQAPERVAAFYDARVENQEDLNAKSVIGEGPAYHHSGIVRRNEAAPTTDAEALAWLYRTEEGLTDLVWNLVQGLCPRQPQRFLDAGCGEGATLARFIQLSQPQPLDVTGITLSQKQADIAGQYVPQGRWLVGDMLEDKELRPGSFDVIVAIESTEYLGPERMPEFMARAARWLDKGGLLLVVAGSWLEKPSSADDFAKLAGFDDHYLTRLSSSQHYRDSAAAADLEPVAELDLTPTTQNYWELRSQHPVLHNSKDGLVETIIAKSLELKKGEFRAYAWLRPS